MPPTPGNEKDTSVSSFMAVVVLRGIDTKITRAINARRYIRQHKINALVNKTD